MKWRFLVGTASALILLALAPAVAGDEAPYKVADGNKVDKTTLEGWKTWRALACERCHGARQEGMVGPSLIESLKRLSKDEFKQSVLKGRPEKGTEGLGAVGGYKELAKYTELGGILTVFVLP